ncbi:hypothetical protein ACLB2K_065792 [Fragaria x ananassa]
MATYRALLSLKSSLDDPDSRLSALRLLNLSNNVFNRTFPPELSNLTNLRVLDLYNNNLTGACCQFQWQLFTGYLDRVFVPYSRLSQVFWLCTNKSPSPQSERVLGWGVILEMPRIGFTQVREAWCRVPKSPLESREVTGVMFRKQVGEKKRLPLPWRVSPRLVEDCRYVVLRPLCGESVRAWLGRLAIERCGPLPWRSVLGWGDSLLSVAGRCPGESVRAWLGNVAMWRVSARLIGDCRYVALRPLRGESVSAWLGRLAIERCGPLPWRVSPRLVGDCRYVALRPLRGESVRAWLGTVAMWRVSAPLIGDYRYVALRPLRGESVRVWLGTVAMWRVSARLIGDCRYVALRPLRGESVRAWLGRLAIERCGPLPWRVSPHLVGDCRSVASQCALDWRLSLCGVAAAEWRVSSRLVGETRY